MVIDKKQVAYLDENAVQAVNALMTEERGKSEIVSEGLILLKEQSENPVSRSEAFIDSWGKKGKTTRHGIYLSDDATIALGELLLGGWGKSAAFRAGITLLFKKERNL